MIYKNIKKTYNNQVVLDIENIELKDGLIYGIKGPNGSGKSTLLKIIARIIKPDNNVSKIFDNNNIENIAIGYLPQFPVVFNLTVMNNMLLNSDNKNDINEILKKFKLENLCDKNAKYLSGGEKQKLCLSRLLIKKYDLLLLDEPTSAMDRESTKIAEDIINLYNKKYESTIVIISHDEKQLERLTNNIYYIENGKILLWNFLK